MNKILLLDGEETVIDFSIAYRNYSVQNLGSDSLLVSLDSAVSGRDEGVTEIPAGGSAVIENRYLEGQTTLYLLGTGKVQVSATNAGVNSFSQKQGGGGDVVMVAIGLYALKTDNVSLLGEIYEEVV